MFTEIQRDLYFSSARGEKASTENVLRLRTISEDRGKTFKLSSLIHKGYIKTRNDGEIIRPINVLIKEGDFSKIYSSEQDFLSDLQSAGLIPTKEIIKKRSKVLIGSKEFTIDSVKNEGLFIEYDGDNYEKVINVLKSVGAVCGTMYDEIDKMNKLENLNKAL